MDGNTKKNDSVARVRAVLQLGTERREALIELPIEEVNYYLSESLEPLTWADLEENGWETLDDIEFWAMSALEDLMFACVDEWVTSHCYVSWSGCGVHQEHGPTPRSSDPLTSSSPAPDTEALPIYIPRRPRLEV